MSFDEIWKKENNSIGFWEKDCNTGCYYAHAKINRPKEKCVHLTLKMRNIGDKKAVDILCEMEKMKHRIEKILAR